PVAADDNGQKTVVAAHHHDEVGLARKLRFALAFLVRDEVVDGGERNVEAPGVQPRYQATGGRGVGELHRDAVRLEKSLALRCPGGEVPATFEGDDAKRRARRLLGCRVTEAQREREQLHEHAKHRRSPPRHHLRTAVGQTSTCETGAHRSRQGKRGATLAGMKTLYLRSLLAAAAFVPVAASANPAITTQGVNMRAGPDASYPQVAYVGPGMNRT